MFDLRDVRSDNLSGVALENMDVAGPLTPHMDRDFGEREIEYIKMVLLPQAIADNDKGKVIACEDVLKEHGITAPNKVSGRWEPLSVPRTELALREMFAASLRDYGYRLVRTQEEFPDWLLLDEEGRYIYTEVEHRSSNFLAHGHDPGLCELVVCWEHDAPELPVAVLEVFSGRRYEPKSPVVPKDRSHLFHGGSGMRPRYVRKRVTLEGPPAERHKKLAAMHHSYRAEMGSSHEAALRVAAETGYSKSMVYAALKKERTGSFS